VDTWQIIADTVRAEFGDIPDISRLTSITMRLALAAALGGVLGFEREQRGKAAGLRTHMLVALGSSLFILVPQHAGVSPGDLTRVLQGLLAGVGFLCAGSIIKGGGEDVKGLTTAAGLWLTAAIGVTVGMGHDATAVLATVLVFVILSGIGRLERYMDVDKDEN